MKKVLFITGTRADFGKLKPLIRELHMDPDFEEWIFVTGMHMLSKFGGTYREVLNEYIEFTNNEARFLTNVHMFLNQEVGESHDTILAHTIIGLSRLLSDFMPDMIVVHGDRVEALAGAVVGAMRNIMVAHIEGGELSGTIDESIRHSITKLAHIHFTANDDTRRRLLQLGEEAQRILVFGSPDIDMLLSDDLPSLDEVKGHYEIEFDEWGLCLFHPVTTENAQMGRYAQQFVTALIESEKNYVVIYPNNDLGSEDILEAYEQLTGNPRFQIFPSIRFEYFLRLLKSSDFMVGNSSAGIREAPAVGVPVVNVGSRQNRRSRNGIIVNCRYETQSILDAISKVGGRTRVDAEFGSYDSLGVFLKALRDPKTWALPIQKNFYDVMPEVGSDDV